MKMIPFRMKAMSARNRIILLLSAFVASAHAADAPRAPDLRWSEPEFRLPNDTDLKPVRPLPSEPKLKANQPLPEEIELKPIAVEEHTGGTENASMPVQTQASTQAQADGQDKVLSVNEQTLLENPQLLARAMYSTVVSRNIAGIKVLAPIYRKWADHDAMLLSYALGLQAQSEGRVKEAIAHYRELIARQPDAPAVRLQLAAALFEDRQNEAAADQFDRLKTEDLPQAVLDQVEMYRKALRERDSWKFNGGFSMTYEKNINQAPKSAGRQSGQGRWEFPKPVDGLAINYQLGAEKKWSLKDNFYVTAGGDTYGKIYPNNTQYNDITARVSGGLGYADQRKDTGLTVFHERRFYDDSAYTYSNGARVHFNRWQTPKLQTLSSVELGRLHNTRRARSDNTNLQVSNSLVFYTNARQYWVGGLDFYRERNSADRFDNFNRYGARLAWGQDWGKIGLSSMLRLGVAQKRYEKQSFFSGGERRRDKEFDASLSLWHRAIHFKGITPRLTVSHRETWSNDVFNEYEKNRMFIELSKTF